VKNLFISPPRGRNPAYEAYLSNREAGARRLAKPFLVVQFEIYRMLDLIDFEQKLAKDTLKRLGLEVE
jgi:hypothetical protein